MIAKVGIDQDVRDSHCNRKGGKVPLVRAAACSYGTPTELLLERVGRLVYCRRAWWNDWDWYPACLREKRTISIQVRLQGLGNTNVFGLFLPYGPAPLLRW